MKKHLDSMIALITTGLAAWSCRALITVWNMACRYHWTTLNPSEELSAKISGAAIGVYFAVETIALGMFLVGIFKSNRTAKKRATCLAVVLLLFYLPLAQNILSLMQWPLMRSN